MVTSHLTTAAIIFAATYVLLLIFTKYRAYIAVASAALFVILGILPPEKIFLSVDWNVILMISGTMGIVFLFIESKMPALMADIIIEKAPDVMWAAVALSLFAGIVSAFVDNVATVLMIAPIALSVSKKLHIDPRPIIIAIAVSSNLQGAATLVGDTTSIMLSGYAEMDFFDFFFFRGRISLFWIVEIGALISTLVLFWIFKDNRQAVCAYGRTKVTDRFPTVILLGTLAALIAASFIPNKPSCTNGFICFSFFIIGLIRDIFIKKDFASVRGAFGDMDYTTLLMLAALFIIIGGITEAGVIDAIAKAFVSLSGDNLFLTYTLIVWFSVAVSAVVDNIPYVAAMLPVVSSMSSLMGIEPFLLCFGLLVGATLGGNLTPIGASANITAIGILEKEGLDVRPGQFMRIGVPFTLSAVMVGYLLLWVIWH